MQARMWNEETTVRRSRSNRRSAPASSSRRVVSLRSTWSPTPTASSAKNASASSSVGSSGATSRSSSSERDLTEPEAAPWLTSPQTIGMRQDERPARQVEHVELDEVDAVPDRGAKRAKRVLWREPSRAAMTDAEDRLAWLPPELDHAILRWAARRHHQASAARSSAWLTVSAAAIRETSTQNRSG